MNFSRRISAGKPSLADASSENVVAMLRAVWIPTLSLDLMTPAWRPASFNRRALICPSIMPVAVFATYLFVSREKNRDVTTSEITVRAMQKIENIAIFD